MLLSTFSAGRASITGALEFNSLYWLDSVSGTPDLKRLKIAGTFAFTLLDLKADVPPIFSLFKSGVSETLSSQYKLLNSSAPVMDALPAEKVESNTIDSR